MNPQDLAAQLIASKEYFDRSTRVLTEEDGTLTPSAGAFSVMQQVAHVGATVDWFIAGAFSTGGFDLDFEKMGKEINAVKTLAAARAWVDRAYAAAIEKVAHSTLAELNANTAAGPVMGGIARWKAILGIVEHTAHHRGALTVYSRLASKVPAMPYMDM